MAKTTVTVELSPAQEIALLNRYGRRCSPETLVKRAIDEVLRQQADGVDVFTSIAEYQAKVRAEIEAERQAEMARLAGVPPAVQALLDRFKAGEKMRDEEGREISALELSDDEDDPEPLMAQFGSDNSEWYPIAPGRDPRGHATGTSNTGERRKQGEQCLRHTAN